MLPEVCRKHKKLKSENSSTATSRPLPISMTVRQIMDGQVVSIESNQTVKQALGKLIQAKVWALIVERSGLPVGVVTEHDMLRRCVAKGYDVDKVKVEEIMTSPIITVEPDMRAGEALEKMLQKNVGRLYVVEGGKVIGRVTQTALSSNLLDVIMALSNLKATL